MPRKGLAYASFADFGRFSDYFVGMCHVKQSFWSNFTLTAGVSGRADIQNRFVLDWNSCDRQPLFGLY